MFTDNFTRGRIVMSVVVNMAGIVSILSAICTIPRDCAALVFTRTITDQNNKSKPGILDSFCKMANLKVLFYVVYVYTTFKYFGNVIS